MNQSETDLGAKRLADDKLRPDKCTCGHSRQAHDSGYSFCWLCEPCMEFESAEAELDARIDAAFIAIQNRQNESMVVQHQVGKDS